MRIAVTEGTSAAAKAGTDRIENSMQAVIRKVMKDFAFFFIFVTNDAKDMVYCKSVIIII